MSSGAPGEADQARLAQFRVLLAVQVAAATVFGLGPLLLTGPVASATHYSGNDPLVYRLAGASTFGYAVIAAVALAGVSWQAYRIAAIASASFTGAAAIGCLFTIAEGDSRGIVLFILVASAAFTLLSAYWLQRDEGGAVDPGSPITPSFRVVLGLATLSAAVFGVLPLLVPGLFAQLFGVPIPAPPSTDHFIFRMAGAATFGYAVAGVFEMRAAGFGLIRLQNLAAITFNALAFLASAYDIASGGRSILAPVILLAAGFFTVALTVFARRHA
jgi:hypothetical protein